MISVCLGVDNRSKLWVFHGVGAELAKVESSGVVGGVCEAVRIGKIAAAHADIPRKPVHFLQENADIVVAIDSAFHPVRVFQQLQVGFSLFDHPENNCCYLGDEVGGVVATG